MTRQEMIKKLEEIHDALMWESNDELNVYRKMRNAKMTEQEQIEEITKFDKLCRDYNKLLYIIRCNMTSITRYIRNENKVYDIRYKELAEKAVENILEAINHRGEE